MDQRTKNIFIGLIKGIVLSVLLTFLFFIVSSIPINLFIYGEDYTSERDFTPVYFILSILYVVANYLVYIRKYVSESDVQSTSEMGEMFDLKADLQLYINSEGKYVLMTYGVLAILFELFYIIFGAQSFAAVLSFCFPLAAIISIPVIRTIVGYFVTIVLLLAATEYARYKKYKYWHDNGKR